MEKIIPMKRLPLRHAQNARDLGGFPAGEGKSTRWLRLFRSDCISGLDAMDWGELRKRGVCTVIDLRSVSEGEKMPDRPPEGVELVCCPLQKEKIDFRQLSETAAAAFTRSMRQGYCKMLEESPEQICGALEAVAEGLKKGAVLFHCTAGKDRTGVLAAVILELLGVPEEDIVADYQVSFTYNRKGINEMAKRLPDYQQLLPMLRSEPEDMQGFLNFLRERGGAAYLKNHGLKETTLEFLKEALLET